MEKLAVQLSEQTDYTSYLLAQLNGLEESQVAMSRELAEKQSALQATLQVADKARADVDTLSRRLEVREQMLNELTETNRRLEAAVGTSGDAVAQLSASQQRVAELNGQLDAVNKERADLHAKVDELSRDLSSLRASASASATEEATRASKLKVELEASQAEVESLRRGKAKLVDERDAAREAARRASEEAAAATSARDDAMVQLHAAQRRIGELDEATRVSASDGQRVKASLAEAQARLSAMESDAVKSRDAVEQRDIEIASLRQQADVAARELKARADQIASLNSKVEALTKELTHEQAARAKDTAAMQKRLSTAHADLSRLAEEARARERAYQQERRAADDATTKERTAREESFLKLQADLTAQHTAMRELQTESTKRAEAWAEERDALEKRNLELSRALEASEEAADEAARGARDATVVLSKQLVALRRESVTLSQRHVATLSALDAALRQLATDAATSRDEFSLAVNDMKSLERAVIALSAEGANPMEEWYAEIKKGFLFMMDRVSAARDETEDARDDLARMELKYQEQRSKAVMLEEQVDSLQHDIAERDRRAADAASEAAHRVSAAEDDAEAARRHKIALQKQLDEALAQLSRANEESRALVDDKSRSSSAMVAQQERHSKLVADLEQHNAELTSRLRAQSSLVETLRREKEEAERALDAAESERGRLARALEMEQATSSAHAPQGGDDAEVSRLRAELASVNERLQKTASMLQVVTDQKKTAQSELRKLKAAAADKT